VYDEIMRVPLYVRVPGRTTAGTTTDALASHIDLARTVAAIAGVSEAPSLAGIDLTPVLANPSLPGRPSVLFAQDSAWYERCIHTRYAIRGVTDGRYKYARYYGVGGSTTQYGTPWRHPKLFDTDAAFADQDHELYDLGEDPYELVNLANDRGHRPLVREWFHRLKEEESTHFGPLAV
jgi:arylsulfatase A-like enzyme